MTSNFAPPEDRLTSVAALPRDVWLDPGERQRITAVAFGPLGLPIEEISFIWGISDSLVGSIQVLSSNGAEIEFTAGEFPGTFPSALQVTAFQQSSGATIRLSSKIDVNVLEPREELVLGSVESLFGEGITVGTGQLLHLSAIGYDPIGRPDCSLTLA